MPEEEVTPEAVVEEPKPTVEVLQKQLEEIQATSLKNEENWKNSQRDSSKKNAENQRLREQLTSNESQASINKALIAMMASQRNQSTDDLEAEVKTNQPDLMKQYEQILSESTKKQEYNRAVSQIKEIQDRASELGVTGDDLDVVRAFAVAGEYSKAEARLDRIESAKQTKPSAEPKESESDRIERLANERARAILLEKGVLEQDTGAPSASATSTKKAYEQLAKGEITEAEAIRKGCTFS